MMRIIYSDMENIFYRTTIFRYAAESSGQDLVNENYAISLLANTVRCNIILLS